MFVHHHHSSFDSRSVPWLGEGLSMLPPIKLACIVLSSAISYRSSISSLVVGSSDTWSQNGDTRGHRSSLSWLMCPAQDHFIFPTLLIIQYDFCPLSNPDAGLSVIVCDVEHTYFHFGLCCRKFVLSLFGESPCRSLHDIS